MSAPDVRRYVGVCMACHHWQVDVRPGAVSDLGGSRDALMAVAEAHNEHRADCPNDGGRIRFAGQWADRPKMASGKQADAVLQMEPLPPWWVTR